MKRWDVGHIQAIIIAACLGVTGCATERADKHAPGDDEAEEADGDDDNPRQPVDAIDRPDGGELLDAAGSPALVDASSQRDASGALPDATIQNVPDASSPIAQEPIAGGTPNSGTWTGAYTDCLSSTDYICNIVPTPIRATYNLSKNGFLLSEGVEMKTPGQTFIDKAFGNQKWRLLEILPGGDKVTMHFDKYQESSSGSTLSQGQTHRLYFFMLVADGETWERALERKTQLAAANRAHMQIHEESWFTFSGSGVSSTSKDVTFYNADLMRP
jgi:hypothetical protein